MGTVPSNPFWCFIPWPCVLFSHACTDQYSSQSLRGDLCRCLECSLCAALLTNLPMDSTCLGFLRLATVSLHLSDCYDNLCLGSPYCTMVWQLPSGESEQLQDHHFSRLSGITVLHCLISNVFTVIISFSLSIFFVCFKEEGKSNPC